MKKLLWPLIALLALGSCKNTPSEVYLGDDNFIQYKTGANLYTVVYAETGNMSQKEARKKAMVKAAQVTKENGYRYFVVDYEKEVVVEQQVPGDMNQRYPQNLYHDMIMQGNFGPGSSSSRQTSQSNPKMTPGIKIVFRCFKEHPGRGAVDACELTGCG